MDKLAVNVQSEIGTLEAVILHIPGPEVESMTPGNAHKALYSDILNLKIAQQEYAQLSGVLNKFCKTFQVSDLLTKVLDNPAAKQNLIHKICEHENANSLSGILLELDNQTISKVLVEGLPLVKDNLTNFLSTERFSLKPLYNFYFTRDASMSVGNRVLIGKMANAVRDRESIIMDAIFSSSGEFTTQTMNPALDPASKQITIEGGDVLVARDDILIIGNGMRTNTHGIDFVLAQMLAQANDKMQHIIVQELPSEPESFIHLDMVFTLLDRDKCMAYEPLIVHPNRYLTTQISIQHGKVVEIKNVENILTALKSLGMSLEPIFCGGTNDRWNQEREQWHSGANFVCLGPGKVLGYARNTHTMDEMNRHGFEILRANDVIDNKVDPSKYTKFVISIQGSELPRGGGGARCMTMPVSRKAVEW